MLFIVKLFRCYMNIITHSQGESIVRLRQRVRKYPNVPKSDILTNGYSGDLSSLARPCIELAYCQLSDFVTGGGN